MKTRPKLEEVVKQEKMLEVFQEYHRWNQILGISTVGDLNVACNEGHATDLINVSEALQEKKIAQIADEITHRDQDGKRVKARAYIRSVFFRKNHLQQAAEHPAYDQRPEALPHFTG